MSIQHHLKIIGPLLNCSRTLGDILPSLTSCLDDTSGRHCTITYHFHSFHSRDIHEGDSREVQDQAVDVHSGNSDHSRELRVPVQWERKVLEQIQLLQVDVRVVSALAEKILQAFLIGRRRKKRF